MYLSPSKEMYRTLGSIPHPVLRPVPLLTEKCVLSLGNVYCDETRFPPMRLGQRQRPFSIKFLELQEPGTPSHPMLERTRLVTTLR